METLLPPKNCRSMAELGVQIDTIDVKLIEVLAIRSDYIDRAVDLKIVEGLPARTTDRVAEVLDRVSAAAADQGMDPALARTIWSELIERSIQREIKELGS
ncbi:hypothetical protein ROLI_013510 [Roseobacter fucihabitans]|uniref:chorismate mutase n=1 Tax=Roseobacter fucihabitans TaxID=1537242 RepID=A0ABZ2BQL3_9RHOB|nr:chorismate mutase [Roseobacter litoralis]MBC6967026.1 Salicylate biosynthesis protein PchB [Roseobacter litoralis]